MLGILPGLVRLRPAPPPFVLTARGELRLHGRDHGNILCARFGIGALPATWLENFEWRPEIECLADDLAKAVAGARLRFDDYPPS